MKPTPPADWISVKDELPPFDKWVLVYAGNAVRFSVGGDPKRVVAKRGKTCYDTWNGSLSFREVTHWRDDVPEAPET